MVASLRAESVSPYTYHTFIVDAPPIIVPIDNIYHEMTDIVYFLD